MSVVLIYTVFETPGEAADVARSVVTERLAACANILSGCQSIYEWDGIVRETIETPVIFKTTSKLRDTLMDRLIDLHAYHVPAIVAIEGTASAAFEGWIMQQVS